MARVKLTLPENFSFSTHLPVRVTDLNYGGHVGNDTILSLIHEARMQFLQSHGLSELQFGGASLIMGDAAIEFKRELFYGEDLKAYVTAAEGSRVGFALYYKLVKGPSEEVVALARTGMVCFDYTARKVTAVPGEAAARLSI